MKVEQILQSKGADVFAIRDDAVVAEAVSVLTSKNVGAVVVYDGASALVGILSERDVVRRLGARGPDVLKMRVRDCMTSDPFTCTPGCSLDDLMALMTEKRVRHLPVVVEGDVLGVVSIGDVVKRKIEQAEQEARVLKDYIAS